MSVYQYVRVLLSCQYERGLFWFGGYQNPVYDRLRHTPLPAVPYSGLGPSLYSTDAKGRDLDLNPDFG